MQTLDKQANAIKTGLYIAQSLYYPIIKNLYIGAELNIGVSVFLQSGKRDYNQTQYDRNGDIIYQFKHIFIVKDITYVTLDLMPMLSLKYKFKVKSRNSKE